MRITGCAVSGIEKIALAIVSYYGLEQHTGFEPVQAAWKAAVLPLHKCCTIARVVALHHAGFREKRE